MNKAEVAAIKPNSIGQSVERREDLKLLSGNGQYVADIRLPNMHHAAFLRSPYAHARITGIDTTEALNSPGVVAIWTGADMARLTPGITATLQVENFAATTQPALANETVRYVGEPVAIIIATNRALAEDALELIEVDYDDLATVGSIDEALAAEHLANPEVANNIIHQKVRVDDDVDPIFDGAAYVAADIFHTNRVSASPMETRGCVASHDWTTGHLSYWAATQIPGMLRTMLAMFLQIPEHTLEVITPQVGGGFGQKAHVYPEDLTICALARELDVPISWIEDRQENLLMGTHAKHQKNAMRIAFDQDGHIEAIENKAYTDGGAYNCLPWTVDVESGVGAATITGAYRISKARSESTSVTTNKCPIGAYRGVGWTAGQIARETLLDRAARELNLSPFEIRRRNVIAERDFPFTNATGLVIREGTFMETVDLLERMVDYDAFHARQIAARAEGRYLGLGLSVFNELSGTGTRTLTHLGAPTTTHDTTTVRMDPTGTVTVTTSFVSSGQGHATTFAQVAADALGVPVEKVVILAGSTANTWGLGTFASRAAAVGAGAIGRAAERIREKIREIAAHMLEASPADIVLENDQVHVAGVPSRGMSIAEIAGAIYFAEATHPEGFDPTLEATATFDPGDIILANGGHAAIVEVDIETGIVNIEKIFAVEDCGQMINPMIVEGQIRGGIGQAVGSTLLEELIHDEYGQLVTTTFMDYLLPTAMDVPDIEIAHLETPSDLVPGGIKGMGESAMISAPAAIVGAVNDALASLDVSIVECPISPQRVFRAVSEARR